LYRNAQATYEKGAPLPEIRLAFQTASTALDCESPDLHREPSGRNLEGRQERRSTAVEEVGKLLDLLSNLASDDEFRAEFERSPAKVLAEFGVDVPGDTKAIAPPKEALAAALNNLAREMTYPPAGYHAIPTWTGPFPQPWGPGPYPQPWSWIGPFPLPWSWSR
jgi:putative modified peptide